MEKKAAAKTKKDTSVKPIAKSKRVKKLLEDHSFDEILKASLTVKSVTRETKKK